MLLEFSLDPVSVIDIQYPGADRKHENPRGIHDPASAEPR